MGGFVSHTLFQGLARPPMMFGVTYSYMIINGLFHLIAFIATTNFWIWGSFLAFHFIGKLCCYFEPNFIDIGVGYLKSICFCKNQHIWKVNSYEAN